ncbi:MAG: hypothetical protein ABIV06_10015, partial [Thermoanaerobaculia bacterium]
RDAIGSGSRVTAFWMSSLGVAMLALFACRKWPRFALAILPLSVAFPWALASSEGPQGSRFPSVQVEHVLAACALVLIANLVGMQMGGFRFVFFTRFPGRGDSSKKGTGDSGS